MLGDSLGGCKPSGAPLLPQKSLTEELNVCAKCRKYVILGAIFAMEDGQITVSSLGEARIESARAWKAPAGKPHYVKDYARLNRNPSPLGKVGTCGICLVPI